MEGAKGECEVVWFGRGFSCLPEVLVYKSPSQYLAMQRKRFKGLWIF